MFFLWLNEAFLAFCRTQLIVANFLASTCFKQRKNGSIKYQLDNNQILPTT